MHTPSLLLMRLSRYRYISDVIGIAWILLFVALYLSPSLKDGGSFGPSDLGSGLSQLTNHVFSGPNHNVINGDIITQEAPWNFLNWRLVHAGQFPFWNSYSGTGLPQFLNFESASLSLPSLVGYAFPVGLSYLVVVAMKLILAGTGTYVLVRLLKGSPIAAAFAGTTFMLSGAFSGWLGWAVSGPVAWLGWIGVGLLLAYQHRRVLGIAILSASIAFSIYAGFPESEVLLLGGFIALIIGTAVMWCINRKAIDLVGIIRVAGGAVLGLLLSCPLWLPGLPLLRASARAGKHAAAGIPLRAFLLTFAQGYDGLPIKGSTFFGPPDYYETAAYIGIIAVVLAGIAVLTSWRRAAVFGFALTGIASLAVVYRLGSHSPIQHLIADVGFSAVALQRMLPMVAFAVAVLAGFGIDICRRRWNEWSTQVAMAITSIGATLVVLVMWLKVHAAPVAIPGSTALVDAAALRRSSLIVPTVDVFLMLAIVGCAVISHRRNVSGATRLRNRVAAGSAVALLVLQSTYLLFAGVGLNSYSHNGYPITSAISTLQRVAGTQLVGIDGSNTACAVGGPPVCGIRLWQGLGIYPEMNIAYGIDELAMHDPLVPADYFASWPVPNSGQVFGGNLNLFTPAITSVALARRYGVAYVIVQAEHVPAGMTKAAVLVSPINGKGEIDLYRVPGGSQFSFANGSSSRVVKTTQTSDRSYTLQVATPTSSSLTFRVTNEPGWHASADGVAIALHTIDGSFLSGTVPAKTHTVTLSYWPKHFDVALVLALLGLLALIAYGLVEHRMRRLNP